MRRTKERGRCGRGRGGGEQDSGAATAGAGKRQARGRGPSGARGSGGGAPLVAAGASHSRLLSWSRRWERENTACTRPALPHTQTHPPFAPPATPHRFITSVRGHLKGFDFSGQYAGWRNCPPSSLFTAPLVSSVSEDCKASGLACCAPLCARAPAFRGATLGLALGRAAHWRRVPLQWLQEIAKNLKL